MDKDRSRRLHRLQKRDHEGVENVVVDVDEGA